MPPPRSQEGNLAPKSVNKRLEDPNFVKKLNVGLCSAWIDEMDGAAFVGKQWYLYGVREFEVSSLGVWVHNIECLPTVSFTTNIPSSGSNRPLTSTLNSYYKTQNGNIIVYDNNGKLMYDISPERVKMFDINRNPQGKEFFNPRKLDGAVPNEILGMLN